jgi:hypothetical protein
VRLVNVCLARNILAALQEKHRRGDRFQFWAQVEISRGFERGYHVWIKLIRGELLPILQTCFAIVKIRGRRRSDTLEFRALEVGGVP